MKKIYRSMGAIALGWLIGSCGDSTGPPPPPPPPPPTTATVVMSDGTASVVPAATVQLSATAKDASGAALSRTIAWSSSDLAKATVSQSGVVTGVATGTAIVTAAVDGKSATSNVTVLDGGVVPSTGMTLTLDGGAVQIVVPADALASNTNLWIVPSTAFAGDARVIKGTPVDFFPNGTTFAKPVSVRIKYLAANLPAGTEEAALQLHLSGSTGWQVVPGSTVDTSAKVVTAELSHFSTYAILTPAPIAAITIRGPPEKPVAHDSSSLIVGDTDQLTATLTDSEGAILSNRLVTWSSSDATVASVTATGMVTAIKPGSAIVRASAGGITSSVTITVTPVPVASVTVSLSLQTIFVGQTSKASAVLKDLAGNVLSGRAVTWSSSNTGVATVDANGLVTAVAVGGPVTITGTSETKSGTSSITVTLAPVNTVTVTPPTASLVLGATPTQQLSAELKDVNGAVLTGRTVTWTSSNSAIATVDANGLVTAVAAGGPVMITATSEGMTGTSSITVALAPVATVTLSSATTPVVLGQIQQLTATPKDASGTPLVGRTVNWVSSNPTVLAVSAASSVSTAGGATVSVTAVGVGTATITASSESAPSAATPVITVTVIPVNTVTVSPTSATLVLGITPTQQLTATLRDANHNVLVGRVVIWSSSNPAAATVDGNGFVTAVAAGTSTITATSETKTSTSSITVTLAPVNTVTVTPPTASLVMAVTPTQQLTAVLKDANGGVLTGRAVDWSSSNPAVASVSSTGLVTAGSPGTATITATSETKTDASSITVSVDPVTAVTLSAVTTPMLVGDTQQLTATPKDVNGATLSGRTVSWVSSNTGVLSVSAATSVSTASGATITVTAVGVGQATITATSETKTATTPTITVNPVPVNTVTVNPTSASLVLGVTPTQQLTAQLKDINGNVLTGRTVTWSSNNTSVATVDANGLVSAVAAGGPVTITATSEGKTGTSSITVAIDPVTAVTLSAMTTPVLVGATQQLTATPKDVNGATLSGRTVSWVSGNTAVLTVSAATSVSTGSGATVTVTAVGPGSATITATSETRSATTPAVSVNPVPVNTVTVTPPTAGLVLGVTPTQQLTAVLKDVNGNVLTGRTVAWTSSNTSLATVDANGLVTAVTAGGPVTITATSETKTGTSSITVTLAPVATVTVTPPTASLVMAVTPTQQLTAVLKDVNGNVLTGRTVTWSSNNTAVATVNNVTGLVTAGSDGGATITATSEGKTGTSSITVSIDPVTGVTLFPVTTPMLVGDTQQLTASPKDFNGTTLSGRTVSWVSSNTAVLTVSAATSVSTASGATVTVTAVGPGTATITATSETKVATTPVITVNPVPVNTVIVTPATASLVQGVTPTQQLSAVLKDVNSNVLTGRTVTWSSSNTGIATVDATGLVTAVAAGGPVTITATSEGKSGTSSITVAAAPVAFVSVALAPNSITAVGTSQATATTFDAHGVVLTGRAIAWSSDNTAVATVDAQGVVTAVAVGTANIIATSEGQNGGQTITVTPAPVNTVTVTPPTATLVLGVAPTQQLVAQLKDAKGRVLTGRTVSWTSSSPAIATVDANGLVTAAGVGGPVTITATSETKTGTSSITVAADPVNTVTVSPSSASLVLGVTPTQQMTTVLKDVNNNVLTGRTVTWSSSNTGIATVDGNGLVTAVGAGGPVTITATSETKTGTSSITVTVAPVNTVTVTPPTASLVVGVTPTQQLAVQLKDVNGNVVTGRTVVWTSSNTAVATVDANGLVTAIAAGGPITITATSETKTGTSSITVALAPVNTVTLSSVTTPMLAGETQSLTATPKDVNGVALSGRTVSWVSSNTAVLTVSAATSVSTASGATITVTAVGPGSATITATSETKTATTPAIAVNPVPVSTVTVTPPTATLVLGVTPTQQLSAQLKDVNGVVLTGRTVTWSSSNTAIATVDANGLVTAVAAGGPITITATSETKTGTSSITITPAPVNTVTVTPSSASLVIGVTQTQQLTAVLKDVNGAVLTGRTVTWSSSNTGIATVDGNGLVTAVGAGGPVTITATSETKTGTSSITVTLAPVTTVTVSPPSATLVLGVTPTQQLTAELKDVNGAVLTGRTVNWSSDNTAVATVDATGLVTAVGAGGPVTITATSETKTGTSSITVTVAPVNTVTVNPTSASLVLIATPTQQLTAILKDVNGAVLTGRVVTWTSSNEAVATVDASGLVTAVAAGGPVTITATSETKTGTSSITVAPPPVASVTLSTLPTPLPVGMTQPLTATTKDANRATLTGRSVSWVSSDPTVLTVSPTSGPSGTPVTVTAVGVGTATITATSETKTATTPVITVIPPPVETITLSAPTTPAVFGTTQQLTATPKDFAGNTLVGRTVNWVSSNTAVLMVSSASSVSTASGATMTVTAVGVGHATITATSETKSATTPQITVNPLAGVPATLLSRSVQNPRYFQNESGQAVYLTGSHTWSDMQDNGTVDPPPAFNYSAYLDFLTARNHNFTILWAWEQSKWTAEIATDYFVSPGPFKRVGPDLALDGKPKFDLTQFDQAYFDRLRSRVQEAGGHGIYVAVMLFDGWSVTDKGDEPLNNPWQGHPFNAANNINGIDPDTNHDGRGLEVQTLGNSAVTDLQDAYVRKVIDAVGDLDNVLYEIDNEGDPSSKTWQYHMIQVIRDYEATKGKQHPIGMTPLWPNGSDADLTASGADWIAPTGTGNIEDVSTASGAQVLISDTDHLCGICGTVSWIWKAATKGQNPILMDGYDGQAVGFGSEGYTSTAPIWEILRANMGRARSYVQRMDLALAVPHGDKVSAYNGSPAEHGYCLAKPGSQYLVFLPGGGNVTLDLTEVAGGSLIVEWLNPITGDVISGGTVPGGPSQTLTAPFAGDAVLFLH